MHRSALTDIKYWFKSENRKPLILKGARQVGKTYLVESLAEPLEMERIIKFDFKADESLHAIFSSTKDPKKIIDRLSLKLGHKIDRQNHLVFFDEIQDCPEALSSLKYFAQDMKDLAIIAAGSHLGLVATESSFPVGKVDFISMFPLVFEEFVENCSPGIYQAWKEKEEADEFIHDELVRLFFAYLTTGGLPEIVARYIQEDCQASSLHAIRKLQKSLLEGYEGDFSKYSGTVNANHIHHVFRQIPKQLAQFQDESVKKFKFSGVIPNQKGFDRIIGPLGWLSKSRLCIKTYIANRSGHPLLAYTKENLFKTYFFDVGLLNCALDIPPEAIYVPELDSYKGFIVENFVAQEFFARKDSELVAWREGQSELEFLLSLGSDIVPIEVKAAKRARRAKSLYSYLEKYKPKRAYMLSLDKSSQKQGPITRRAIYQVGDILQPLSKR